jgi:hypothetical protein
VEFIRGSASATALETLLQRGLVEHNRHHLLVTTPGLLQLMGLLKGAALTTEGAVTEASVAPRPLCDSA